MEYSKEAYDARIAALFERHQSVQSVGFTGDAYKPGLEAMLQLDAALGRPSEKFRSVHVAGTNGKGTVCSMLAAQLSAAGMRVGLYTSPHLLDFRERIKVVEPQASDVSATCGAIAISVEPSASFRLIPEKDVWDFLESAEKLLEGRSFFEITTALAFWWFARQDLDIAVIETGLGGRLDSTNIITPELSIITGIGLDHCAILGDTRAKIAAEKAGIFKPGVPAIVGEWDEETAPVFEARALEVHCPLFFVETAPEGEPLGPPENLGKRRAEGLTPGWAGLNHPTVRLALDLLGVEEDADALRDYVKITGLRGRWETHVVGDAELIFDIGHNPPALEENFARLEAERSAAEMGDGCSPASVASGDSIAPAPAKLPLTIVYGVMADKDLASISHLMPADADYVLVAPATSRAMPAATLGEQLASLRPDLSSRVRLATSVAAGVDSALSRNFRRIIYIGGSTFVVSEAIEHLETTNKWEQ
jgi:dihydrofolate synthase/folylpolyglutamate synthase